jgi:hypothetical protein
MGQRGLHDLGGGFYFLIGGSEGPALECCQTFDDIGVSVQRDRPKDSVNERAETGTGGTIRIPRNLDRFNGW